MKKLYILINICFLSITIAAAQSVSSVEQAPLIGHSSSAFSTASVTPWQVLYNYDLTTDAGTGNAGVCFLNGNEYWVSKWASADFTTFDSTGTYTAGPFSIPGITGVRSITTDGTSLFMGLNTAQIKKVNPITQTVISTINTPAVPNVRYVTYDPTANGGAGGFWCGTWTTDWTLVSLTGTFLSSVSATSHGLLAVYGLTYDGTSPGGPYLWAFNQTNVTIGAADIVQVEIATGMPTSVIHDVTSDMGVVGDLAGGLYLQTNPLSLVGILQGSINYLFGYDINLAGVNENAATSNYVSVYPNPAKDMVNIGVKREDNRPMHMQIINSTGQVVYESNTVGKSNMINMSKYPSGIYIANISGNGEVHSTRIIHM